MLSLRKKPLEFDQFYLEMQLPRYQKYQGDIGDPRKGTLACQGRVKKVMSTHMAMKTLVDAFIFAATDLGSKADVSLGASTRSSVTVRARSVSCSSCISGQMTSSPAGTGTPEFAATRCVYNHPIFKQNL